MGNYATQPVTEDEAFKAEVKRQGLEALAKRQSEGKVDAATLATIEAAARAVDARAVDARAADVPIDDQVKAQIAARAAAKLAEVQAAQNAETKVRADTAAAKARLAALAAEVVVPPAALEAYFDALGFHKTQFVRFTDKAGAHTQPIESFAVLYHRKTDNAWVPRAPSPYEPVQRAKSSGRYLGKKFKNDTNPRLLGARTPTGEFVQNSERIKAVLAPAQVTGVEARLRAYIVLQGDLREFEPVFCAVLVDRVDRVRYTIPVAGLQRADERHVAELFWTAYASACRPPGWTLRQKVSDADRYIRYEGKKLRDETYKDPSAVLAQAALEKKLADYAVGSLAWNRLSWRVYLVGQGKDDADVAVTRRLPGKGGSVSELQRFGYTKSGFQDAPVLLPPVGVYVRTPFVGRAETRALDAARKDVAAAKATVDARIAAKKADATLPDPSGAETRALQLAEQTLVAALTPPVYLLDVVNIAGPVFQAGSREYSTVLDLEPDKREAWIVQRLEQCFDVIFFVAEHENKHAVALKLFGSAPDFVPFGLELSYAAYFAKVLQATMALHPDITVYFEVTPPEVMPGTHHVKFPTAVDENRDALFVNDMGPDYVVGNCNFADKSLNGYFGSHSAMAFLTEPAVNTRITVKTITSTPRDYTLPPPPPPKPMPLEDPFTPPDNQPSDYVVEVGGTLEELALRGDARVRDGYVPCGGLLEHEARLHQAFVRLEVAPAPLWLTFTQNRHRVKN
jgi:hypothetical protein